MSGIIRTEDVNLLMLNKINYQVETPVYHGPLDLLLQLIERAELDITKLSIAQVTDQYLDYLENLPELSVEEVSAFLVIAAKLIQIKSEMLLPRPPKRDAGEEDPGEALARQLLLYRKYKLIAEKLDQLQCSNRRTYVNLSPVPEVAGKHIITGVTIADLIDASIEVYSRKPIEPESLDSAIKAPKINIRQRIHLVAQHLRKFGRSSFRAILGDRRSRESISVTFLAMLELIKLDYIVAFQRNSFSEIELEPLQELEGKEEFELEFGE